LSACLLCAQASSARGAPVSGEPSPVVTSVTLTAPPAPLGVSLRLPLSFEPNVGQANPRFKFVSRGPGYRVELTATEALIEFLHGKSFARTRLHMWFPGADPDAKVLGAAKLPGVTNYFVGSASQWHPGVPNYARLVSRNIYPGVDLVYHGKDGQLEYDLVVAPGADPGRIRIAFGGIERLSLDPVSGDLLLTTFDGAQIRHERPRLYQMHGGQRQPVSGRYRIVDRASVAFELSAYDSSRALIIDPTLVFTTLVEGNQDDWPFGVTVDNRGYVYVTGVTDSGMGFPFGGNINAVDHLPAKDCSKDVAFGWTCPNAAFLMKLTPAGAVLFASYFGGNGLDLPHAIATDSSWVYVVGETTSSQFLDHGADYGGPLEIGSQGYALGDDNAFMVMFDTNGQPIRYTLWGAPGVNAANGVAVDAAHAVYVAGATCGDGFPTSALLSRPTLQAQRAGDCDGFVTKIDPWGFLGYGYSTYLGGKAFDYASAIAVESDGFAWVTGQTCSDDFPVSNPALNKGFPGFGGGGCTAFVTKILPDGSGMEYSLFLGGLAQSGVVPQDSGTAIAINGVNGVYVAGFTFSPNFYTTANAVQRSFPCGSLQLCSSAFVAQVNAGANVPYSTYLGAGGAAEATSIVLSRSGRVYVAGDTVAYAGFPGATTASIPNPTTGFVTSLSSTLDSAAWTDFLGTRVESLAIREPSLRIIALPQPSTIYMAGMHHVVSGLNDGGIDGFVRAVNDAPVIVAYP
jgi:hypothetical protein